MKLRPLDATQLPPSRPQRHNHRLIFLETSCGHMISTSSVRLMLRPCCRSHEAAPSRRNISKTIQHRLRIEEREMCLFLLADLSRQLQAILYCKYEIFWAVATKLLVICSIDDSYGLNGGRYTSKCSAGYRFPTTSEI